MPRKETVRRARADLRAGKKPTTAAGEFVREEIEHVREGKHGARSTEQAIAIGLSKARRAGVPLKAPAQGTSTRTRRRAERDYEVGQGRRKPRTTSGRRKRATTRALQREPHAAASPRALARHTRAANKRRASKRKRTSANKRRAS